MIDSQDIKLYFFGNKSNSIIFQFLKCKMDIITLENYFEIINKENIKYKILITEDISTIASLNLRQYFYRIYNYNDLYNNILTSCQTIYFTNYDYNFLKAELRRCLTEKFETLIVGNSYSLCGIENELLNTKSFNLSMHSQDLYYSYKLAKECIENNKNIKKCIIGVGHYTLYNDLSKCKGEYQTNIMKNVYVPLLKDKHNSCNADTSINLHLNNLLYDSLIEKIFDLDELESFICCEIHKLNPKYFATPEIRKKMSYLRGRRLSELSYNEKVSLCEQRISTHNNFIKYNETYREYTDILKEFLELLKNNNIEPILIYFPLTKIYLEKINQQMRETFYETINSLNYEYNFSFIDFNKSNLFNENDFADLDHLNEYGCMKVCNYLNNNIFK